MKKLIALFISVVLILSMGIPAFADSVNSPESPINYVVTCYGVQGVKDGSTSSVIKGSQVTLTADKTRGVFDKWTISGKYTVVSGGLDKDTITIKPDSDVTVTANFNPNPQVSYKVTCIGVSGVKNGGIITVDQGNNFTVTPNETLGTFFRWGITGSYDVVSGALNEKTLTLTPKSNLIVVASIINIKTNQSSPTDANNSGNYEATAGSGAIPSNNNTSSAAGSWNGNSSVIGFNNKRNQLTVGADKIKGDFKNWDIRQLVIDENGETTYIPAEAGIGYVPVINPDDFGKNLTSTVTSSDEYQKAAEELKEALAALEKEADDEKAQGSSASNNSPSLAKEKYLKAFENYVNTVANKSNKTVSAVIDDILKSPVLTVIPLADIVITGNYGAKTAEQSTDGQTTAPQTGDYSLYFALIALLSLAGVVVSKKVFSK